MAIVLEFDGVDDFAGMSSTMSMAIGATLTIKAMANSGNTGGAYRLMGRQAGYSNLIEMQSTRINIRIGNTTNNFVSTGYTKPAIMVPFILELERLSSSLYEVRLDSAVIGQISSSNDYTPDSIGGFGGTDSFAGQIESIVNGTANSWDANTSAHTAGTPVLTDSIGGNDATGVNMPTAALGQPGSAWIDLGGGGISLSVTETLNSFDDSSFIDVSANVSLSVTEVLGSFVDLSNVTVTAAITIEATVTESFQSFADSSAVTVTEAASIDVSVTEVLNSFIDSSALNISANIDATITEVLNSFLDGSNVTIAKDITITVTEVFASFTDNSFVRMPTSWVDKDTVTTVYINKTPASTDYTTKPTVSTIWTDKG